MAGGAMLKMLSFVMGVRRMNRIRNGFIRVGQFEDKAREFGVSLETYRGKMLGMEYWEKETED